MSQSCEILTVLSEEWHVIDCGACLICGGNCACEWRIRPTRITFRLPDLSATPLAAAGRGSS
jgi:hypothetical protein